MEYGNQYKIVKTFHDWCIENNRMDLDERFDVEKKSMYNERYWMQKS